MRKINASLIIISSLFLGCFGFTGIIYAQTTTGSPIGGYVQDYFRGRSPSVTDIGNGNQVLSTPGSRNPILITKDDSGTQYYRGSIGTDGGVVYEPVSDRGTPISGGETFKINADGTTTGTIPAGVDTTNLAQASSGGGGPKFVITSEKIPGSDCSCIADDGCKNPATKKYQCTVGEGLSGFQDMFASIIRYTVNIVLILSVLAIIGLGIAWTMAGGDDIKAKSSLKSWAINICIGLIILFFFRYILQFFAPWIYK